MSTTVSKWPWRERIRQHRIIAGLFAAGTVIVGPLAFLAMVEGAWSAVSDDPLLPWVGATARDRGHAVAAAIAVVALAALVISLLAIQRKILEAVRIPADELPDDILVALAGMTLHAGSDLTIDWLDEAATTARTVWFSARHGHKTIVKNKPGTVDAAGSVFRLPLVSSETRRLRDGYLLVQVHYQTGEGNRLTTNVFAVKTAGQLVPGRLPSFPSSQ